MTFRKTLAKMWNNVQLLLFPEMEDRIGPLTHVHKQVIAILELVRIEEFVSCTMGYAGRPTKDRHCIARAFIAKTVLKIPYTKQLVERLKSDHQLRTICGWDSLSKVPSEAKFSRTFKVFAKSSLPEKVHQALVAQVYEGKIIGHLVKDSTPISAREKYKKKEGTTAERRKQAQHRYEKEKKGELVSRRQKQLKEQTLEEMIQDLPTDCDIGAKRNSMGYAMSWKGYKLHAAVDDHCIPIAVIVTSASLNDCEAGIPLANKADKLVKNFYDLMDSAYDVSEIKEHSLSLGHVPIIDKHSRSPKQKVEKGEVKKAHKNLNFRTAEEARYQERCPKERFNAMFKDFYGGRNIFYKGHSKISCHIMFGVLALTAANLLTFVQ